MHVISRKALVDFWRFHPPARGPMTAWFKVVEGAVFANFAAVRGAFNSADKVGPYTVFNVGGAGYRIVTAIHYNRQKLYIRHVFTHSEYDRWTARVRGRV
jgi:mRNA interferase HigB